MISLDDADATKNPWVEYARTKHRSPLQRAYDRYHAALTLADQRIAYRDILLCGGRDGYPTVNEARQFVARCLRRVAATIDHYGS